MNAILLIPVRLLVLTIVYFVCFIIVSGALLSTATGQTATDTKTTLIALLVASFINAAILAYIILRSRWTGLKLILTIFVVLFGVMTLMSQIETAYFVSLPSGMLPRLFIAGGIIAAIYAPLAVLILGKAKARGTNSRWQNKLQLSTGHWIFRLAVIVIAYVLIYFIFGYYVVWKNPAVRSYYGGTDPGTFIAHMANVVRETPGLLLLQVLRALLWTAIAIPVIQMMRGAWSESGLAVALLFAVLMNTQLLLPNPLMPTEVRMAHLLEIITSNFLFGWLLVAVLLLGRRRVH